jgi:hypothetical protein
MDPFVPQGQESEQRSLQARVAAWFSSDAPPPASDMTRLMQNSYDRGGV